MKAVHVMLETLAKVFICEEWPFREKGILINHHMDIEFAVVTDEVMPSNQFQFAGLGLVKH